jgi:hypothetical protein
VSSVSLRKEWDRALARASRPAGLPVSEDIVEFAESLGFELDPWQVRLLRSKHPRKILLGGRQVGKSLCASLACCHLALTEAGSTSLIIAPSERQSKLIMRRVLQFYRQLGFPLPARSERVTGLELANGSIVESVPAQEKTTRGYSIDLLVADECAAIGDVDFYGISPALAATKGHQLLMSTPRTKIGFFAEIHRNAEEGPEGWYKETVRSDQVPHRISPEDLETYRRIMPREYFEAEFLCQWLEAESSLFSYDDVQRAVTLGEEADVRAIDLGDLEW